MIGLLKKAIVRLANQLEGKFITYFQLFVEPAGGPEQGYRRCFANVTSQA